MPPLDVGDPDFRAATRASIQRSVLAAVTPTVLEELLTGAYRRDIPAHQVIYRAGGDATQCGVVVSGLLRLYLVGADGREVTLRYGGTGTLAGAVIAVSGPVPTSAQAVVDTSVLMLDLARLRAAAHAHAEVAWALAEEIARAHRELVGALADATFGSIRRRVARHLLDIAVASDARAPGLSVALTQQELADAVGSVREVVARTLREFRTEGLVETGEGRIVLPDPVGLGAEADAAF